MNIMLHVIKTNGTRELFSSAKISRTCFRACLNAHLSESEATTVCNQVLGGVDTWIKHKKEDVSSKDITEKVAYLMALEDIEAAFMYKTHRDIA